MKSFLIYVMTISSLTCFAQSYEVNDAWLPEKYVHAMISTDSSNCKFLIPIEGFENPFTNCKILTFRGELSPINTTKVDVNGKEKHQLFNLQYYINLKYNSEELVKRLSESLVYISMDNDKLLLEIINSQEKEDVYFINKINNHEFKSIDCAKDYLQILNQ
ncbi:MAG: hypothetical protein K9H64_01305 [Bacteroidales bacterium]|nr:hypothetical protein [Bacteroidales bacterium]MCF8454540.1 hypothetical protein [Bacteroidales bacterium]